MLVVMVVVVVMVLMLDCLEDELTDSP